MTEEKKSLVPKQFIAQQKSISQVDDNVRKEFSSFRKQLKEEATRRILFAYDATGSRGGFWEMAKSIQSRMIEEALQYGNIEMKIVAYRDRFADPQSYIISSKWSKNGSDLQEFMMPISAEGGGGNDGESVDLPLKIALEENPPVTAIILVGDEPVVSLSRQEAYAYASELGKRAIPVFAFQEGDRSDTKKDFQTIAERSGGIFDQFTPSSKIDFCDRLRVATVFATGGEKAMDEFLKRNKDKGNLLSSGAHRLAQRCIEQKK